MFNSLGRILGVTGQACLLMLTAWIMIHGYRIVSGQSRDSMMAFSMQMGRAFIILFVATGVAAGGNGLFTRLNTGLSDTISTALTGSTTAADCTMAGASSSVLGCTIDSNLALMQTALGAIQSIDTGDSTIVEDEKNRAMWMSGIGVAGPAIIAGVMLLLNKFAMALFVAFGPIFIVCLIFEQTKPLFSKWLMFGISTTFTTVMLAVVTSIAMKMVAAMAGAILVAEFLGSSTTGFTQAAMQQGGLGMILSTLLITVPPMAGNFFSVSLGGFSTQNAFMGMPHGGGGNKSGGSGSPAVQYAGGGVPAANAQVSSPSQPATTPNHSGRTSQSASAAQPDTIKTNSHIGNAQTQQSLGASATATNNPNNSNAAPSSGSYSNASESVASKGIGDDSAMVNQKSVTASKTEA